MERIWLKNYPENIPADIDNPPYLSLAELIADCSRRFADSTAFHCMGSELTYREVDEMSDAMASYYQHHLGLQKGDRIALMLPNILQYPVCLFGAIKAGLIVVNINPLYTARELKKVLGDSQASTIVVLENFAHVVEAALPETSVKQVLTTQVGDFLNVPKRWLVNAYLRYVKRQVPRHGISQAVSLPHALALGRDQAPVPVDLDLETVAMLQYTGGTTGVPKGAMLTHRNICSNVQILREWFISLMDEGNDIAITALPLYHIFSFTANCILYYFNGGMNVLIPNPRDLDAFVKELSKWKFTYISGVNTLFNALLNHPEFPKLDFSHLRLTIGGGMAVQKVVAERWQKVTGCVLSQGYGLTETSPVVTVNRTDITSFSGSIGMPIPSTHVSIRDDEGNELPVGEPGELCVKGPQVAKGYWNRPDETASAFKEGGWFCTGDIATIDEEGYLYIVDRKKDMILVSGFNVFPNEIEDVVSKHPKVLEVAAVGIPDDESGEVVKLFVVKKDASLSEEELIAYCRENFARYKVPKQIEFRKELPKSNVGKILRRELREEGNSLKVSS